MKLFTYEEWKNLGFHVKKGEKSTKRRINGVPLFTEEQVEKTQSNNSYTESYAYYQSSGDTRKDREKWYSEEDKSSFQWVDDGFGGEVLQQYHDGGGTTTHFGGPCGPLYTDEFGEM